MPVRELFVILNPAAGRGRAAALEPAFREIFRRSGVRYELVRTAQHGDATDLAAAAARGGWPGVVAIGGDGVVHEVANGLMRAADGGPSVPMGVIGAGSGNDFEKMLGGNLTDYRVSLERILRAEPRAVDVGRVNRCEAERAPPEPWYFTNGVGLGFDAQVAVEARRIRRLKGFAIYAAALLRVLHHLRTPRMRVTVDGREIADRPLILATASNGACHGGSFWLCPGARIDDGKLDVLIADARSPVGLLGLIPLVMRGRHLGKRGVYLERGRVVSVSCEEPLPLHADGELTASGVREIEMEVLPGRLRVLG